ncbi:MAG: ribosomal L7Ae/L30e/S12e/Gadd45 family protein [Candidatus Pacearchaeota archaeon]
MANQITELMTGLKENRLIFGGKRAVKLAKEGMVEKVYLSNDCPENIEEELKKANVKIVKLNMTKEALADLCKKTFNISAISLIKKGKDDNKEK